MKSMKMILQFVAIILALISHIDANSIGNGQQKKNPGQINGGVILLDHCTRGGICKSYDETKLRQSHEKAAERENAKVAFREEYGRRSNRNFDITKMDGVQKEVFTKFLQNSKDAKEQLFNVFKYLTQMKKEPICVTHTFVDSLAKLGGQTSAAGEAFLAGKCKDSARQSRQLLKKQVEEKGADAISGDAFLFGQDGVVEIFIAENGFKCAESLLHPKKVAIFIQQIIKALEAQQNLAGEKPTFAETINWVVEYLDKHPPPEQSQQMSSPKATPKKAQWVKELKEEWKMTWTSLKEKGIRKDLEDFAIWLLRPSHIDGMIQIILFITGLESTIDLGLMTLQLFGIDQLFSKAIEKIGVDMEVTTGIDPRVVRWAFGPNGVIPLFVRFGQFEDEKQVQEFDELVDKAGQRHKVIKMGAEEEAEFLKKIVIELIEHKGRPMHELMDNLIGNFRKMEGAIQKSWNAHIVHWEAQWEFIKSQMNAKAIRADLKKFAVWFVTPDRVNNLIQLILTATNLDTPFYLGLSVLEMFGVTDLALKEMNLLDRKLEITNFVKNHPRGEKAVEFMIGKDGVVALFLKSGDLSSEEWREDKNGYAADLIQIVGKVLIKHKSPEILVPKLYEYLLETVQSQDFYLEVLQKWNEWVEEHHEKLKKAGVVTEKGGKAAANDAANEQQTKGSVETEDNLHHHQIAAIPLFGACLHDIFLVLFPKGVRPTAAQIEAQKKAEMRAKSHGDKGSEQQQQHGATKVNGAPQCLCEKGGAPNAVIVHSATGWTTNGQQQPQPVFKKQHSTNGSKHGGKSFKKSPSGKGI